MLYLLSMSYAFFAIWGSTQIMNTTLQMRAQQGIGFSNKSVKSLGIQIQREKHCLEKSSNCIELVIISA